MVSAGGLGADAILKDKGWTGAGGIAKFDFDKNGTTDAWGVYRTNSTYVAGGDIGTQLEYTPPTETENFLGTSTEIGGSFKGFDVAIQSPDIDMTDLTITLGAGPGIGGHYSKMKTDVFIFWYND